ncbi:hypothetical protein OS493_023611 [Desmophyllum pertusum]|uniref:Ion transport domain-containing protein n=1 Tax=Desmophyllum pertusum TaxID=174260 RepID=A0A9X0CWP6_9CNID|nr:hypothetical protein OS493_023611 [Desmophyllum pertusum]
MIYIVDDFQLDRTSFTIQKGSRCFVWHSSFGATATFAQFFVVCFLFIVAFGLGFHILLFNQKPYSTPSRAMLKTTMGMLGEYEYDTVYNDFDVPPVTWAMYVSFLVINCIIIMNLLLVDDIKGVQEKAVLKRLAMQVDLALDVEKALPAMLRQRFATTQEETPIEKLQNHQEALKEEVKEVKSKTRSCSRSHDSTGGHDESTHETPRDIYELQYQGDCSSQEEVQSRNEPEEEADVEQNTLHFFEEFRRETFEDETVFPRYFDKTIQALVEKCKETKGKERRPHGSSESESFPPLNAATISSPKKSNMEKRSSRQEKSRFSDLPSDDYQIGYVNGRVKVRLVNLGFHQKQSDRHERITAPSRQHHDGFLESELLQKLMLENPNTYLSCTLRLNSEIFRMAYAAVYCIDIISPHERQFVCKVDYENPQRKRDSGEKVMKVDRHGPRGSSQRKVTCFLFSTYSGGQIALTL